MNNINQEYKLLDPRKVFENSIETFKLYEQTIARKLFKVHFSDRSTLEFCFNDNNICHLLGIDFERARNILIEHDYFYDCTITSYEVVSYLFDNVHVMLNLHNNVDPELFSLHKMRTKADSLKLFSDLENLSFFRVHRLSEMIGYNGNLKSNNFLVIENNSYLNFLGIANSNEEPYIETVFCAFNNEKFLKNQKITFPLQIEVDGKYYSTHHKPLNIVNKNRRYYQDFARYNSCYFDDSFAPTFIKKAKRKKKELQKRLVIGV